MTIAQEFSQFWDSYPRRVGKIAAERAYRKARNVASAEEIAAGLEAYLQTMPQEMRFRPHPATWLNQGRWMDEFPERQQSRVTDWFDECRRLHDLRCGGRVAHDTKMWIEKQRQSA